MPLTPAQLLDVAAFSSIWYWLLLALIWTRLMHAPFGVPAELIRAAAAGNAAAAKDLEMLSAWELRQHRAMATTLGPWRAAAWGFSLSALAILALGYRIELAEALLLVAFPMALLRWRVGRTARALATAAGPDGRRQAHQRLRWQAQVIGITAVFVSAVWGMLHMLARASF